MILHQENHDVRLDKLERSIKMVVITERPRFLYNITTS